MRSRIVRVVLIVAAACNAACTDSTVAAPVVAVYALESIDGLALPFELLTDYDMTVSVISDEFQLRSDSTFIEVAELKGVSSDTTILVTETVSGTYTVAGASIYFLTTSANGTRMTIDGATLSHNIGRRFVYRRR